MLINFHSQTLNQVTPKPSEVKAMAATQHKNKNRSMEFLPRELIVLKNHHTYMHCLPFAADKHRVHLKGVLPDYIHATAVNVK